MPSTVNSPLPRIPEDFSGAPNPLDTTSRYAIPGEAKRIAESICGVAAQQFGLQAKIARCFSFVGPGLPLDGKFAAGNFLRDALAGGPINITGDGSAVRSYMYASDLAEWLWMILFQGTTGNAYNVGSEEEITIRNLAKTIAKACNLPVAIRIMKRHKQSIPAERYVPDTTKIRMELGLRQWVGLKEGICAWRKSVMDCGKANG